MLRLHVPFNPPLHPPLRLAWSSPPWEWAAGVTSWPLGLPHGLPARLEPGPCALEGLCPAAEGKRTRPDLKREWRN